MITQNPIIGRAKKKLGSVYARTMYGKNILQTCPPPTKGRQTQNQIAACTIFGYVSKLSNQLSQSLLNNIFYQNPSDRNRRQAFNKQLHSGVLKSNGQWIYDPSNISQIGTNTQTVASFKQITPIDQTFNIPFEDVPAINGADTSKIPLALAICPSANYCDSINYALTIENNILKFENASQLLVNRQCFIFVLWQINIGTQNNPIYAYGSYKKP